MDRKFRSELMIKKFRTTDDYGHARYEFILLLILNVKMFKKNIKVIEHDKI